MKKIIFLSILSILFFLIIEISSACFFFFKFGFLPYRNIASKITSSEVSLAFQPRNVVFHPYLGWVNDVSRFEPQYFQKANIFGFMDYYSGNLGVSKTLQGAAETRGSCPYVIGIFGGSVAQGLAHYLQKKIAEKQKIKEGLKEVVVLNFAMPGYKQPQNLYAFLNALNEGVRFDCVINLDGFNEIISGYTNQHEGEQISYPAARVWRAMTKELTSRLRANEKNERLEEDFIIELKNNEKNSKSGILFAGNGLKKIFFKAILLKMIKKKNTEKTLPNSDYFPSSPKDLLSKPEDTLRRSREIWLFSSFAMHMVCKGMKVNYYHFFQPNQWDPRNGPYKPIKENHEYKWVIPMVKKGYRFFSEKTEKYFVEGQKIIDLAGYTKNYSQDVWLDDCCHLTDKGNEIVWTAMKKKME